MKKILALILILATLSMMFVPPAKAATKAQIDAATALGVAWLATQQETTGCYGPVASGCWASTDGYPVGTTALVVWKLEVHAVLQGLSPFDPAYAYSANVVSGLNYLFANAVTHAPSSGVYFQEPTGVGTGHSSYDTGLALVAIASGAAPSRVVDVTGSPVDGMTYHDVAVGVVNFLAWAQNSAGTYAGGWYYDSTIGPQDGADNSVVGHVVMGLLFAEARLATPPAIGGFGLTIPATVKTLLNTWIGYIQNVGDPDYDGGSGYDSPTNWVNIYKTGHLLQEMAFVGDTSSTPRVQSAVAYLVRHWNDADPDPGWKGSPPNTYSSYIATLMVMKGLVALGINTIGGINWFNDFADTLLAQQNIDGSWPIDGPGWSDDGGIRSTAWALLTLEKAVPSAPSTPVAVGGTVMPSPFAGLLALLPWILMAFAAVGAGAYAMRKRYASPLLARIR
jgi:hypothetical protein